MKDIDSKKGCTTLLIDTIEFKSTWTYNLISVRVSPARIGLNPNLRRLDLTDNGLISSHLPTDMGDTFDRAGCMDKLLANLGNNSPNLYGLALSHAGMTQHHLLPLESIVKLHLVDCGVTDSFLFDLAQRANKLEGNLGISFSNSHSA